MKEKSEEKKTRIRCKKQQTKRPFLGYPLRLPCDLCNPQQFLFFLDFFTQLLLETFA